MNVRKLCSILLCLVLVLMAVPHSASAEKPDILYGQIPDPDMYGRSVLEKKDNAEALLYAYDQIAAGIGAAIDKIDVDNGGAGITPEELQLVEELYHKDYVGHFWYAGAYSYSYTMTANGPRVIKFVPQYTKNGAELEAAVDAFEAEVKALLAGLTPGMSEGQMELYFHDQLAKRVTYANGTDAHNAYGALIDGVAVCEGYAEAFGYLLQRVGIQTFLATGSGINPVTGQPEAHEWNYVRIDGNYYQVDVTWDDQGDELFHMYFNETDEIMAEDHILDKVDYELPVCNNKNDLYFFGTPERLETYTVDSVAALLKNNGYKDHVYIPENPGAFIAWFCENILQIAQKMGIQGAFSYAYLQMGHEFHLEIIIPGGAPQGIRISGVIHSHAGESSPVTVSLCKDGQVLMSVTVFGLNAAYGFDNVMPGDYTLQISENGYITEEIPLIVGDVDVVQDVEMYLKGDVTGDGKVNNRDVTRLLQHLAGWEVPVIEWALDVNNDGKVNNRDATRLLQFLAGWDVPIYHQMG